MREFSSSIKACEKMSSIQQEVWELQRWKDVNNPKVQAEMVVTTVEEVIRSHTAQLLEDVEPKKIWKEIQRIHQVSYYVSQIVTTAWRHPFVLLGKSWIGDHVQRTMQDYTLTPASMHAQKIN